MSRRTLGAVSGAVKDTGKHRRRMMARVWRGTALGAGLSIVTAWGWAAAPQPHAAAAPKTSEEAVATVGPTVITRDVYEQRWALAQKEYRDRTGADIAPEYLPTARRQVLELLIRQRLLILEAQRLGINGTAADAEQMLRADPRFVTDGRFDPAKYDDLRTRQPAVYQRMLADIQSTFGARKLSAQMDRDVTPTDDEVRTIDTRALTTASVDYLPLIRTGFDGSYPEPTESELLAEYRGGSPEVMRPPEFHFSVVFVDQPPLPESLAFRVDQREAWDRRMQHSADSLIAAARDGASLERLAAPFGGVRSTVITRGSRWPAWWHGSPSDTTTLFALAPGRTAPHSYPGEQGRVVIRLDDRLPVHPAPLREVAPTLRERLRRDARAHRDDRAIEALYHSLGDQLRGPANSVLYGVADTSSFPIHQPTDEEMRAYYQAHLTDFSEMNEDEDEGPAQSTGAVRTQSYPEVRSDIYRRLANESRRTAMTTAIRRVAKSWEAGRRDAEAERALTRVQDAGMVPQGGRVDTSLAGLALTDSLAGRGWDTGVHVFAFRRGLIVSSLGPVVASRMPTLEQARPELERRLSLARTAEAERGARALYDEHPDQFRQRKAYFMGRMIVPMPFVLDVPVTRGEVERYYQQHIAEYSSKELVRIREILVAPRDGSDAALTAAHDRADSLLARARAGEDFSDLARRYSDDPASRASGGELGLIARGTVLPEFERVAFSLKPGELGGPVRTEVGYHVLQCMERMIPETTPLAYCYTNVSSAVAKGRIDQVARDRADSLLRTIHTPAQARVTAHRLGYTVFDNVHPAGEAVASDLVEFFKNLEQVEPGHLYPRTQLYRGLGYAITWIDSIVSDRLPPYGDVQSRAIQTWNVSASDRAMRAKRAELDSLARGGWSLDSLAALFGGFSHQDLGGPGTPLTDLGGPWVVDSLVYGMGDRPAALAVGQSTGWVGFPNGLAMIRVVQRVPPDAYQLAARASRTRERLRETRRRERYTELAKRFPVRVVDVTLAGTSLPEP
ncbi:MAG: peptidylprolyl isomerase [Candidatus Eisenbacteria bacterium]